MGAFIPTGSFKDLFLGKLVHFWLPSCVNSRLNASPLSVGTIGPQRVHAARN